MGTKYKGPEIDIWSLGVVLYVILTKTFPFESMMDLINGIYKKPTNRSPGLIVIEYSFIFM